MTCKLLALSGLSMDTSRVYHYRASANVKVPLDRGARALTLKRIATGGQRSFLGLVHDRSEHAACLP